MTGWSNRNDNFLLQRFPNLPDGFRLRVIALCAPKNFNEAVRARFGRSSGNGEFDYYGTLILKKEKRKLPIRYKIQRTVHDSAQVVTTSDAERLVPGTFPGSDSWWLGNGWDKESQAVKLIQTIGILKKFGFVTPPLEADYWIHRYKDQKEIEQVLIRVGGSGFHRILTLNNVKVVPLSMFPFMAGKTLCFGFNLEFGESDIDASWTLHPS